MTCVVSKLLNKILRMYVCLYSGEKKKVYTRVFYVFYVVFDIF